MVDLRAQNSNQVSMTDQGKRQRKARRGPVAPDSAKSGARLASSSSDRGEHTTDRKSDLTRGNGGLKTQQCTISASHSDMSLLSNDAFAFELARVAGLEAVIKTINNVSVSGLLHSFGRQGEVILCGAMILSGCSEDVAAKGRVVEFICLPKCDIVSMSIRNALKSGMIVSDFVTQQSADSVLEEPAESPVAASPALSEPMPEESAVFPLESTEKAEKIETSSSRGNKEKLAKANLEKPFIPPTDDSQDRCADRNWTVRQQPSRWNHGQSHPDNGRHFSTSDRKWNNLERQNSGTGNQSRNGWNDRKPVHAVSGQRNSGFRGANSQTGSYNRNYNRSASFPSDPHAQSVKSNQPLPADQVLPVEVRKETAAVVPDVTSVKLISPAVSEAKLDTPADGEANDSTGQPNVQMVPESPSNPWTSDNVWHRRNLRSTVPSDKIERPIQEGSRILGSLTNETFVKKSRFVWEDTDNRRCVNSFRSAATRLNPDAPEFQPRAHSRNEEASEMPQHLAMQCHPADAAMIQQFSLQPPVPFYPHQFLPMDQHTPNNFAPLPGMFLPLEIPAGHGPLQQMFPPHAPPPQFYHTMSPGGDAAGIYVPLLPPMESYYASLVYHQMQAAHLASLTQNHQSNPNPAPPPESGQFPPDHPVSSESPHPHLPQPIAVDEVDFPPLPTARPLEKPETTSITPEETPQADCRGEGENVA